MNEMSFAAELHLGSRCLTEEALPDVQALVRARVGHHLLRHPRPPLRQPRAARDTPSGNGNGGAPSTPTKVAPSPRYDISLAYAGRRRRITPAAGRESEEAALSRHVLATALCHNVSPVESSHMTPPTPSRRRRRVGVVDGVGEHGRVGGGGGGAHLPGRVARRARARAVCRARGRDAGRRTPQLLELREPGGRRRRVRRARTRCPSRRSSSGWGHLAARLRDGRDRVLRQGGGHGDGGAHRRRTGSRRRWAISRARGCARSSSRARR